MPGLHPINQSLGQHTFLVTTISHKHLAVYMFLMTRVLSHLNNPMHVRITFHPTQSKSTRVSSDCDKYKHVAVCMSI